MKMILKHEEKFPKKTRYIFLVDVGWFVQRHYGDFKSNLSWKHESIEVNCLYCQVNCLQVNCLHESIVFMSSNFRNPCHNKRPNFLSQWEQSKVLPPYFFVFTCAHEDSLWTKNNVNVCVFMSFQFQRFLSKKAEFLITMRATKSFDTILFVSSCLQISEIPVTIKGRISYHNESNQKSWLVCLHLHRKTV